MSRAKNLWALLPQYILIVVIAGGFLWAISSAIIGQRWDTVGILLASILFVVGYTLVQRRKAAQQIAGYLQLPTPAAFIAWNRRLTARLPYASAHQAAFAGTLYAYYGQFDQTQQCIAAHDWASQPPLVQAQGELLEALLDFLDRHAYQRGLERVHAAHRLSDLPDIAPGNRTAQRSYTLYLLVAKVLTDTCSPQDIADLESNVKVSALFIQILGIWGLALAYHQQGNQVQYQTYATLLRTKAPHCVGLALPTEQP